MPMFLQQTFDSFIKTILISHYLTILMFLLLFLKVYMEIRCPDGGDGGRGENLPATHEEIHPTGILSVVANLTPWSNHNQSPRNMYQCQVRFRILVYSPCDFWLPIIVSSLVHPYKG